jgi:hypothetical protein
MTDASVSPIQGAVDEYVRSLANDRYALEQAIAQARARLQRAQQLEQLLLTLEQKLGRMALSGYAEARAEQMSPDPGNPTA